MKYIIALIIGLFVGSAMGSPADPDELQVARCEPTIYFLLGMSSHKQLGSWEYFYPGEPRVSAVYDRVAYFVSDKLGFVQGAQGEPESKKEARWRARFVDFIDRFYSRYYSQWGETGLVLDTNRLFSDVRRSSSLDAYLAGAYARYGRGSGFRTMTSGKAASVAALLNRRIDSGVILHTYIGYTPGGASVEFRETEVLRKIFDSWKEFADAPNDADVAAISGGAVVAEFAVVLKNHAIGKKASDELPHALSYELDRREIGFVFGDSYSTEEIEIEMAVYDEERGLRAIRSVLVDYAVPKDSIIRQTSPVVRDIPAYQNEEAQPGATDNPDDAQRLREDH